MPAQVAELLGLPSVTFAKHIEVADGTVKVERQTEAGYDEVECPLPALVTVTAGVVEPRYPSFKGIMAAKNKPVDELTVADLGLDADQVGWAGAAPGDHRRQPRPRSARPARSSRTRATPTSASSASSSSSRSSRERSNDMADRHDLGLRRGRRGQAALRHPRAAHQGARARRHGRGVLRGRRRRRRRAPSSASTAPPRCTRPATSATRCWARRWPRPWPRRSRRATGPTSILFAMTYDGRDVAGRLSAKLDRPVLTNGIDVERRRRQRHGRHRDLRRQHAS